MRDRYAHRAEQHLFKATAVVEDDMHGTARRQRAGRQVALRGRHPHMLHQQFEQALIAQCRTQQGLVVAGQHAPPGFRLLFRDVGQAVDQRLQQCMLHRAVLVIALQIFAAGGGRQPRGFDHPADETGPRRQQVARVVIQQHAAHEHRQVAVVAGAIGGAVLHP